MKVHLLIGSRIACDHRLPEIGTMTINPNAVTCQRCRKTKFFRMAKAAHRAKPKKQKITQMEFFTNDTC